MKLSDTLTSVLKNFSGINSTLSVKPGNVIRTMSPTKSVMASFTTDVEFEKEFAIYDLSKFLGVLALFDKPELEFDESGKFVKIGDNNVFVNYVFASPSVVSSPPNKDIALPSVDLAFKLTSENLNKVLKASTALQVSDISVKAYDGKVYLIAHDKSNSSSDSYQIEVGESEYTANVDFVRDNLKFLPLEYNVEISARGLSKFTSTNDSNNIVYWVAIEKSSKFN